MKRIRVLISGRVQRVSFRAFIRHRATLLGLKGYVKNLESGCVEAVFEGKEESIKKMIGYCKKGPLISRVKDVDIKEEELEEELESFKIKY